MKSSIIRNTWARVQEEKAANALAAKLEEPILALVEAFTSIAKELITYMGQPQYK